MGQTCGILPVGIEKAIIRTKGLKWNMGTSTCLLEYTAQNSRADRADGETSFNGLVSTSNHLLPEEPIVTIQTDQPLLWCIEIKEQPT